MGHRNFVYELRLGISIPQRCKMEYDGRVQGELIWSG